MKYKIKHVDGTYFVYEGERPSPVFTSSFFNKCCQFVKNRRLNADLFNYIREDAEFSE